MNIVKTDPNFKTDIYGTYNFTNHTIVEDVVNYKVYDINTNGLTKKYTCFNNDDADFAWYQIKASGGRPYNREFSVDNQEILKIHLLNQMKKKDKLSIVEIGVNRNGYVVSSTSIFLDNKREQDIYVGIDIEDKSSLDDTNKNIFTVCSPSQNIDFIHLKLKELGVEEIDILMIDGYHSINQVYCEWENYTKLLSSNGVVVMHDTNSHPGPYFLLNSIDTNQYDVYKYLSDVVDWGIGVAVRK